MRKRNYILLASLILMLIFSACGGGNKTEESSPSEGQPTATSAPIAAATIAQSSQEAAPTNPPPTAVSEPTAVPSGEESGTGVIADLLNLNTLKTDVKELSSETLQSYRLRAEWRTEPKEGSTTIASSLGIEVAHTREPLAEEVAMRGDESGAGFHTIRIEDRMWMSMDDQWIEMSSGDASTYDDMLLALDSATAGLGGDAKLVGEETVNGIETRHYAFDESILGTALGIYSKIKGDVWMAVDGEYAVKYVYSAEDEDATYYWEWEVYDINAPFVIEAPADAQGVREDIPVLADATDRASFGAMLSYSTASDLKTAIEFYRTEMAAQGWTYDEAGSMISDQFASLNFNKDGATASVMISPGNSGGASVVVQTGE